MNKHKYMNVRGEHVVGGPLVGWMFSDAVSQVGCPRCGSDPGYHCETPKGREAWPPHTERTKAVIAKVGSTDPWTFSKRLTGD